MPTTKCEKRKYGVAASVVPNQSPSTKRRKDKEPADGGEASDMVAAHNVAISGLAGLLKILTAKVEGIDVSVADKVTKALDATIDSKVEARLRVYDSDLQKQIAKLEAQINDSKNNAGVNIAPDVATSKAYEDEDDGACSNDLITSQDGLPVDCVVKKEKKDKKTMDSTHNLTNKEVIKTEKKAGIPLRRVKQEKAFEIPQLNDESISSKDLENHLQWEKNVKLKRIITGEKVSKEPYDPLAKVEAEKLHKVLDFIKSDLEAKEPGVGDESAGFFLKLMIPRDDWPTKNYGWLHDSHIAAAMLMFHRRSRQEQSLYSSSRIAFLSHWVCELMGERLQELGPEHD
ncbi:BnaC06g13880D [Brassica napus]|uniref:BnaC06g13880D protein n=2 Tax=Brassica napus TaxID=3708 RepID=A0A078FK69_BRANA|nr:BnaC06g13880D [Brassica napus]